MKTPIIHRCVFTTTTIADLSVDVTTNKSDQWTDLVTHVMYSTVRYFVILTR